MRCDREGSCPKEKSGCKVGCHHFVSEYDIRHEDFVVREGVKAYNKDRWLRWEKKKLHDRRKKANLR